MADDTSGEANPPARPKRSFFARLRHRAEQAAPPPDTGPYTAADVFLEDTAQETDKETREGPPPDY
jgi:hypothetical protein